MVGKSNRHDDEHNRLSYTIEGSGAMNESNHGGRTSQMMVRMSVVKSWLGNHAKRPYSILFQFRLICKAIVRRKVLST